jgi:hypothetical protein
MDYAEWRACERFGILPPGVQPRWEDNHDWIQALLIAYSQIRSQEEVPMMGM